MIPIILIFLLTLSTVQTAEKSNYWNYTTTPYIRLQWPYEQTRDITPRKKGTGSLSFNNHQLTVSTGATSQSYAAITSKKTMCFAATQKAEVELHAFFSTPIDGTTQHIGLGNEENGFFIGYNGTTFGILHRYGGKRQIHTLLLDNAPAASGTINVTLDGKTPVAISIEKKDSIGEATQKIANADFSSTGFSAHYYGDKVVFISDLAQTYTGTFSVTESARINSVNSFTKTISGTNPQETWIAQTEWNGTKLSDLNPTKGQVFLITSDSLGYGHTKFYIRDPFESSLILVHTLSHAQGTAHPSLSNPILPLSISVKNNTKNECVAITCAAMSAYFHESNTSFGNMLHTYNEKTLTSSEKVLIVLRSPLTIDNHAPIICPRITSLDFGASNNSNTLLKVIKNPTLKGNPSFNLVAGSSGIEVDTTIDEYSGGTIVYSSLMPKYTQKYHHFNQSLILEPGDILAFVGKNANELS